MEHSSANSLSKMLLRITTQLRPKDVTRSDRRPDVAARRRGDRHSPDGRFRRFPLKSCLSGRADIAAVASLVQYRRMRPTSLLLFALMMCSTSAALACRYNASPGERIYKAKARIDTLAVGVVDSARYLTPATEPERAWSATVRVQKVIRGKTFSTNFEISRTGQSSMCDDGVKLPSVGDKWALYVRHTNGGETVELAYPVAIAADIDPLFQTTPHIR